MASLPVPAVVGTARNGRKAPRSVSERIPFRYAPGLCRVEEKKLTNFAVSRGVPPPTAMIRLQGSSSKKLSADCKASISGFAAAVLRRRTATPFNRGEKKSAAPLASQEAPPVTKNSFSDVPAPRKSFHKAPKPSVPQQTLCISFPRSPFPRTSFFRSPFSNSPPQRPLIPFGRTAGPPKIVPVPPADPNLQEGRPSVSRKGLEGFLNFSQNACRSDVTIATGFRDPDEVDLQGNRPLPSDGIVSAIVQDDMIQVTTTRLPYDSQSPHVHQDRTIPVKTKDGTIRTG